MEETYELKKIVITTIIVGLAIAIFYGITVLVLDNKKNKENKPVENLEVNIQYEEIIVGNLFNQKDSEYYVLATTLNDEKSSSYLSNYTAYSSKEGSIATYTIDLDNAFNKKYLKQESNFEKNSISFKTSTLLKINDGELSEVYEGEEISNALSNLVNNID